MCSLYSNREKDMNSKDSEVNYVSEVVSAIETIDQDRGAEEWWGFAILIRMVMISHSRKMAFKQRLK